MDKAAEYWLECKCKPDFNSYPKIAYEECTKHYNYRQKWLELNFCNYTELARECGVSRGTIQNIATCYKWANLKKEYLKLLAQDRTEKIAFNQASVENEFDELNLKRLEALKQMLENCTDLDEFEKINRMISQLQKDMRINSHLSNSYVESKVEASVDSKINLIDDEVLDKILEDD